MAGCTTVCIFRPCRFSRSLRTCPRTHSLPFPTTAPPRVRVLVCVVPVCLQQPVTQLITLLPLAFRFDLFQPADNTFLRLLDVIQSIRKSFFLYADRLSAPFRIFRFLIQNFSESFRPALFLCHAAPRLLAQPCGRFLYKNIKAATSTITEPML